MENRALIQQRFDACLGRQPEEWDAILGNDPPEVSQAVRRLLRFAVTVEEDPNAGRDQYIGRVFGRYEVTEVLDAGGMGILYIGRDTETGEKVVVKFQQDGEGSAATAQFQREQEALSKLSHPGICRFFDAGFSDDIPYLVMEYIEGAVPITAYCQNNKLPLKQRIDLFLDACEATAVAHIYQIQHRDLSPGNILVTQDGTVKVIDFGLAKLKDQLTATLTVRRGFKFPYGSPEQVTLEQPTDTRTDVYSLGAVLFEVVCDQPLFKRPASMWGFPDDRAEREIIKTEPPPPVEQVCPGAYGLELKTDLESIWRKALRKDPEQRYQTVQELADDLRRYLAGEPVHAQVPSLRYRAGKYLNKHLDWRSALVLAASLAVSVLLSRHALKEVERRQHADAWSHDLVLQYLRNHPLQRAIAENVLDPDLAYKLVVHQQKLIHQVEDAPPELATDLTPALAIAWQDLAALYRAVGDRNQCEVAAAQAARRFSVLARLDPPGARRWSQHIARASKACLPNGNGEEKN
ncbi:MAG: serine/threonine protein kinase [Bryobacterales bacterium]|nr:serine/threonine protein kinase [Bryobacterales bacterium]